MNDRTIKICVLVLASLLMIPLGTTIGKKLKGDPQVMGELTVGDGLSHRVKVTAELKNIPNAQLYVSVFDDGETLVDLAPFAMANVMDAPPEFTLYEAGSIIGLSTALFPEHVLFMYDFEQASAWPMKEAGGVYDTQSPEATRMLTALIEAEAAPADASLLENGYMPNNNQRHKEHYEASQKDNNQSK